MIGASKSNSTDSGEDSIAAGGGARSTAGGSMFDCATSVTAGSGGDDASGGNSIAACANRSVAATSAVAGGSSIVGCGAAAVAMIPAADTSRDGSDSRGHHVPMAGENGTVSFDGGGAGCAKNSAAAGSDITGGRCTVCRAAAAWIKGSAAGGWTSGAIAGRFSGSLATGNLAAGGFAGGRGFPARLRRRLFPPTGRRHKHDPAASPAANLSPRKLCVDVQHVARRTNQAKDHCRRFQSRERDAARSRFPPASSP